MTSIKLLAVFIGGGLGSILRFVISFFMLKALPTTFPYGTLTANFLGCFTIGVLMAIFSTKIQHDELKLFFTTGMMGGLTTFSTFSFESISLLRSDAYLKGLTNISVSLIGCLLLTFIGFRVSIYFLGK